MLGKEHIYRARYSNEDIEASCRRALNKWGFLAQFLMCIEELSELIQVLVKHDRKVNGSTKEEIASEIVDVTLMLKQMQVAFGINDITLASIQDEKLGRLEKLLEAT